MHCRARVGAPGLLVRGCVHLAASTVLSSTKVACQARGRATRTIVAATRGHAPDGPLVEAGASAATRRARVGATLTIAVAAPAPVLPFAVAMVIAG
jgi:hypothetical protein